MSYITNARILVVEDCAINIDIIIEAFDGQYEISIATDGMDALEAIEHDIPDLILMDVLMPGMSGYEVCQRLKGSVRTAEIPIIFLTAMNDITDKTMAFEMGAIDYLTKPFETVELKARVKNHLELVFARKLLTIQNHNLEQMVKSRTEQLYKTQAATIYTLAALAETRDPETGEHIKRTQHYIRALAAALRDLGCHMDILTDDYINMLFDSAPLHDIGKVGVPDHILLKPGKLTPAEFDQMKLHAWHGMNTLESAERELGVTSFLTMAKEIAYTHHEKWDGTGYPNQLSGENIPLSGRLMALVDVYDALVTERPYKSIFSHEKARGIIIEGSGKHFDEQIVQAFLRCEEAFMLIRNKYMKTERTL